MRLFNTSLQRRLSEQTKNARRAQEVLEEEKVRDAHWLRRPAASEPLKLAANGDRRRRRWRIRIAPKLKLWLSPKNFLARLRDAYVNLMLRMANSPAISGGFREQVDESIVGLGKGPSKEYDEKVIVDYYNSLRRRDNWCSAMQP
ncbi:unnamed protein product [Thlaspi arvense]|uniref:Uncharacterized protein n=1 Tax=Thlaspi arvense TaxID=13288 RepID=A0AAU9RT61_THLAR|nr:unnamed protein product [Thlaspi arvense]